MPMSEEARRRLLGTSASDRAPWETWDEAMDPMRGVPEHLKLAVEDYSKRRHTMTSSQNLEEVCRQREMSNEMVKEYKFYRQDEDDLGDEILRRGQIMHCLEFQQKLNSIIPCYLSAVIRKGLSGLAVYKPKAYVEDGQNKIQEWQYVCGVQVGYMHEFSTLWFDKHGLPLNEKWRGWRTVILRLIQKEFITEAQADAVFGKATGPASRRHNEQLYFFRNRPRREYDPANPTGKVV